MRTGSVTALVGKGLFAGLAGTAVSSALEAKLRGRAGGTALADAAAKALGIEPESEEARTRLANLVRWGYGAGWGAVRGLMGAAGLRGAPAALVHFGVVLGTEQVVLPALEVAPPIRERESEEIAVDLFHHLIYTAVTDLAYVYLEG